MFSKKSCKECKIELTKSLKVAKTDKCIRCWQNKAYKAGIKVGVKNSRILLVTESIVNGKKIWTTEC